MQKSEILCLLLPPLMKLISESFRIKLRKDKSQIGTIYKSYSPLMNKHSQGAKSNLRNLSDLYLNFKNLIFFYNVVPSFEETSFEPPSMVSISVIIHYTHYNLQFSLDL